MSTAHGLLPYLQTFWRFDRRAVLLSLILNLSGAILEGLGLMLLVPLLSLAGVFSGAEARSLPLPDDVRGLLADLPDEHRLLLMLGMFVGLIGLQAGSNQYRERHGQRLQLRFVDHLRETLFRGIAEARWRFLAQHHSSEFLSVLLTDVGRIGMGTGFQLQLFTQLVLFPVYLGVAFALSPEITGLALLTGALLSRMLSKSRQLARQSGQSMSRMNQGILNELQEFVGALKLIKIHGEETGYQHQFRQAMTQLRNQQLAFNAVQTRAQFAFRVGGAISLALLTYAALTWARLPAANLLVLIAIFSRMLPQLSSLNMGFQQLWHMLPAFENWQYWVDQSATERDRSSPPDPEASAPVLCQGIELDNVLYRHPNSDKTFAIPALHIPARQTTAIVGPTGSGKTTLLDLLSGLNTPMAGTIRVDGQALSDLPHWRRRIAYVPQETAIVDGTLRDNLCWGHAESDDATLYSALRQAAADAFVRRLPAGLDTWVGERGVRLSGGEKQRLALARALLRKPELLILDEATSALDREHQQVILEALRQLHGQTTVIIVTHRHEEIQGLLDGRVRVEAGRVGPWEPVHSRVYSESRKESQLFPPSPRPLPEGRGLSL